jgi:outer membrane protein TolC
VSIWRERLLPHNHELNLAREATRRQRLMAEKSSADRLPDPTLGLRWGSERDGQERTVGLTLAIPLPGQSRAAASRAAMAEADVSSLREAQVLNRVESEIRRQVGEAQARHTQWQRLVAVAERMQTNADLLEKAWRLGEGQLGDLLNARRQAIDANLAATQARLEANESRARLLLDSHQLWDFD